MDGFIDESATEGVQWDDKNTYRHQSKPAQSTMTAAHQGQQIGSNSSFSPPTGLTDGSTRSNQGGPLSSSVPDAKHARETSSYPYGDRDASASPSTLPRSKNGYTGYHPSQRQVPRHDQKAETTHVDAPPPVPQQPQAPGQGVLGGRRHVSSTYEGGNQPYTQGVHTLQGLQKGQSLTHQDHMQLFTGIGGASIETDDSRSATGSDCDRHSFTLGSEFSGKDYFNNSFGPSSTVGSGHTYVDSSGIIAGQGNSFQHSGSGSMGMNYLRQQSSGLPPWNHTYRPGSSQSTGNMFVPPPPPHHMLDSGMLYQSRDINAFEVDKFTTGHVDYTDLEVSPRVSPQQDQNSGSIPAFVLANSTSNTDLTDKYYGHGQDTDYGDHPIPTKPNLTLKPVNLSSISKKKNIPTPSPTTADAASSLVGLGMGMQEDGAAHVASLANSGDVDDDGDVGFIPGGRDFRRGYAGLNFDHLDEIENARNSREDFYNHQHRQLHSMPSNNGHLANKKASTRTGDQRRQTKDVQHHGNTEGTLYEVFKKFASETDEDGHPGLTYENLANLASAHGPTLLRSDPSARQTFFSRGGLFDANSKAVMSWKYFKDHYHLCNRCTSARKRSGKKPMEVVVAALPEQYEGDLIKCCEHFQWVWCPGYDVTGNPKCVGTHRHQSCPKYLAKCTFWKHKKPPGKIKHKRKVEHTGSAGTSKQRKK